MQYKEQLSGFVVGVVVGIGLLATRWIYARPVRQEVTETLRVQRLEVVNPSSKAYIQLSVSDKGTSSFDFVDKDGHTRMSMMNLDDQMALVLYGKDGKSRTVLSAFTYDDPKIILTTKSGKKREIRP